MIKLKWDTTKQKIEWAQIAIIFIFSIIPLFVQLPFKINLFLAWDGAYRLSIGQIPFKDFSLPMGFGFWILPAFFFKIFGPYLYTLIITQSFLNVIGALSFRSILKKLGVDPSIVFLSLLVYCLSFVLINFWPWYNNSVFIFELVGLNFLLEHCLQKETRKKIYYMAAACFFFVLCVFTKQDGGGLAIITATILILYNSWSERSIKWLFYYSGFSILFTLLFILPFVSYDFLRSFNYGQAPHSSRVNAYDFLLDIFEGSQWIKFYLFIVVSVILYKINYVKDYFLDKREALFGILTFCILCQALLVQVTSYIPHNVNVYFHSVGFAFLAYSMLNSVLNKTSILVVSSFLILFWWSADYWRYAQRIASRIMPELFEMQRSSNSVSKYTWAVKDSSKVVKSINWKLSPFRSFKNVLLPEGTIEGIDSIMQMDVLKNKNLKVLNMSELTPLAYEIGFEPLKDHALWFHKNVSVFDQEIIELCKKIENHEFDLVLFEEIPYLNQFYPEEVRKSLQVNYKLVNSFDAPRDFPGSFVEVYTKP